MSQYLVNDQSDLWKKSRILVTSEIKDDEFELISIDEKPKSPEKIRESYMRQNVEPLEKAMEKGADYVRAYYNSSNLRKRKLLEKSE